MTTKAWLKGHAFDLEDLAALLPTGDMRVLKEDDRFYLTAAELDRPPLGKAVHEAAEELLAWANGVGRLMRPGFTPVAITGQYEQEGEVNVVAGAAVLMARTRISAIGTVCDPDGSIQPQPPPVTASYIALAAQNPDVAEALAIMGRTAPPNFTALYKVFEIIEHAGGMNAAMQSAGIPRSRTRLFTRTANHPKASGDAARHARSNEQPPPTPMPLDEARAMITALLTAWMNSL
jgi:hypothetical protein